MKSFIWITPFIFEMWTKVKRYREKLFTQILLLFTIFNYLNNDKITLILIPISFSQDHIHQILTYLMNKALFY